MRPELVAMVTITLNNMSTSQHSDTPFGLIRHLGNVFLADRMIPDQTLTAMLHSDAPCKPPGVLEADRQPSSFVADGFFLDRKTVCR